MKNKEYPYYDVPDIDNMKELLSYCAENYNTNTAIWYKNKNEFVNISFLRLKEDVDRLGSYLYSIGMRNKHIAVLSENSYEWIISYFAIVNGGNVVVPLDKENNSADIKKLTEKADVDLIIHSENYREEAEYSGIQLLSMNKISDIIANDNSMADTDYLNCRIDNDAMCAIVFTSGTTGDPKGVMLSHRTLMKDACHSAQNLYAPKGTVAILPFYHTFGWMACVLDQLILGHEIYLNKSLKRVMSDIKFASPRHISVVPVFVGAMYNGIWDNAKKQKKDKQLKAIIKISNVLRKIGIDIRRQLFKQIYAEFGGKIEMIISGGSGIDEKYFKGFDDLGIKLTNGYGITELSPIVATMRNRHFAVGSVGKVHPGTDCRIKNGEIQLRGETLFLGYYKEPAVTRETFDGEWFKTGDLGYMDSDGLLYITGRIKNLIILSNGKNVSPEELESFISEMVPEIKEVLVYGKDDRVIAEVYTENDRNTIKTQILNLNRKLPVYKNIADIVFRDSPFPKTTTKKIKRNYGG